MDGPDPWTTRWTPGTARGRRRVVHRRADPSTVRPDRPSTAATPCDLRRRRPSTPSTGPTTTAVDLFLIELKKNNGVDGAERRPAGPSGTRTGMAPVRPRLYGDRHRLGPCHGTDVPTPRRRPSTTAAVTSTQSSRQEVPHEVPGRTRRPGRRGCVGRPQPAGPAARSRCSAASCSRPVSGAVRRPAHRLRLRLRGLGARRAATRRSATRAACWSPAGCSPTSPGRCRPSRSTSSSTAPRATISCGNSRFSLPTMPVEDYPQLPAMPQVAGVVPGDVLAQAVAQVAVAAGPRRHAADAHRHPPGDRRPRLTLAATDRFRLAVRELELDAGGRRG